MWVSTRLNCSECDVGKSGLSFRVWDKNTEADSIHRAKRPHRPLYLKCGLFCDLELEFDFNLIVGFK